MKEDRSLTSQWWQGIPLYLQIAIALIFAIAIGILLGAGNPDPNHINLINNLAIPCDLVLRILRTLATPLIFLAVLHTFITVNIPDPAARRLIVLILTNTNVAILVGLLVANTLKPGRWGAIDAPFDISETVPKLDFWKLLQDSVPNSLIQPFIENNVLQIIIISLCLGIALRALKTENISQNKLEYQAIEQVISILFQAVIRIIEWVIVLIPVAVFGIVAKTIALQGFAPFKSLSAFIIAVLLALFLQACYYLIRVQFGSWVSAKNFLFGGVDALITAFSTSSSTITIPVTFRVLQEKIGLKESSASLGALVGSNFNHDGTALYEAMAALFVSQVIGQNLSVPQQFIIVLTSIFASVGAAGIPNAGLVTMTLVFSSVGLPTEYIALLVTVDWFLDRCRTAINVMGDMTVSVLLDDSKIKEDMELNSKQKLPIYSDEKTV